MLLSLRLLRRIARELPRYGKLTYCLYRDPRVPQRNKLALAAALALILNPLVDVPLRIPVFGEMDAVALTVLAVRMFVEKAPKDVVAEHQERIALGTSVFDQDLRQSREGLRMRLDALRGRGLAVVRARRGTTTTRGAQEQVDRQKATAVQREQRELSDAKALAVRLEAAQVTLKLRSGKDGKLFGAVTNADVASALKQQHGITLDRRKIEFEEPVKAMGPGSAQVKLHREVTARIPLMVTSA